MFERVIFAIAYYPNSIIVTWAMIAFSGIENAPFYYLTVLYYNYILLGVPLASSFKLPEKGNSKGMENEFHKIILKEQAFITSRMDNASQTYSIFVLPISFYIFIYRNVLFSSWAHIVNIVFIISLGTFLVLLLGKKGALWWTGILNLFIH